MKSPIIILLILILGCAPGEPLDPMQRIPKTKTPKFDYYRRDNAPKGYGVKWGRWETTIIYCEDALLNSKTREICSDHGYDYRR